MNEILRGARKPAPARLRAGMRSAATKARVSFVMVRVQVRMRADAAMATGTGLAGKVRRSETLHENTEVRCA